MSSPLDRADALRATGKGRRRRAAAELRRLDVQRLGGYHNDEDVDEVLQAPTSSQSRRARRRSAIRDAAREAERAELDFVYSTHHEETDLEIALALSLSLADGALAAAAGGGEAPAAPVHDLSYETLVELESVRCTAPVALVNSFVTVPVLDKAIEACMICQSDYVAGESMIRLPCKHDFHHTCGCQWLLHYSKLCPVCKVDVTN